MEKPVFRERFRTLLLRIGNFGKDITAKNKILLYTGVILLFIIMLMSFESISMYSSAVNEKSENAAALQLFYASRAVDAEIGSFSRVLLTAYIDKSLHRNIISNENIYTSKFEYYREKASVINLYVTALLSGCEYRPAFFRLYVEPEYLAYNISTTYVESTVKIQDESWYHQAKNSIKHGIIWSVEQQLDKDVEDLPGSEEADEPEDKPTSNYLTAVLTVRNAYESSRRRERIAYVRLQQDMNWLDRSMQNALDLNSGTLYILDAADRVVYSSGRNPDGATQPLQILRDGGAEQWNTGHSRIKIDGKEYAAFYQYNSSMGWQLLFITDDSLYSDSSYSIEMFVLLVILPAVLISLALLVLSSRFLTDRLVKLTGAVERIDEDHLELTGALAGRDEVGVLAESFERVLGMVRSLLEKNRRIERERYLTELQTLQERVNPHFLYNTLSSINSMAVDIDAYGISNALTHLADFYRLSLKHPSDIISVREELTILELYIEICRLRFGDRVRFHIEIPEELMQMRTPKLILQPFVENSILHGLRGTPDREELIIVSAERSGGNLLFTVSDNGSGMDAEHLAQVLEKQQSDDRYYALKNTDRRIKLHYGEEYGVQIRSQAGMGTAVLITIPAQVEPPDPVK